MKRIGTIENVIATAINDLAETNPKLVEAVCDKHYFISHVMVQLINGTSEKYVIIDTKEKIRMNEKWFGDHTLELYDKFDRIEHWYRC